MSCIIIMAVPSSGACLFFASIISKSSRYIFAVNWQKILELTFKAIKFDA
jgi:hypothetical protein